MKDPRKQLQIYFDFQQLIKNDKNNNKNLNQFNEFQCLVIPKEHILNWKEYYE